MLAILLPTLFWAALATLLVAVVALPLAYLLARYEFPGKRLVATLTTLPMVIPPTAVGFLLLQLFADDGWLGRGTLGFDPGVILTWRGVVLACAVMSAPLVVRTARVSFEAVDPRLEAVARTLGFSRLRTALTVTLPLAGRGLLAALVLGFARALGEFGASVMIAGNIPGQTQTLASAIYSAQQAGNLSEAHGLVGLALLAGFAAVYLTERLAPTTVRSRN